MNSVSETNRYFISAVLPALYFFNLLTALTTSTTFLRAFLALNPCLILGIKLAPSAGTLELSQACFRASPTEKRFFGSTTNNESINDLAHQYGNTLRGDYFPFFAVKVVFSIKNQI
jgi:hypothetical protein